MAEKEIKITFAGEKLEALSFFLAEQGGKTVEELLKSHLDKSYEKKCSCTGQKICGEQDGNSTGDSKSGAGIPENGRHKTTESIRQTEQGDTESGRAAERASAGNRGRDSRKYDEHGNVRSISERI